MKKLGFNAKNLISTENQTPKKKIHTSKVR